MANSTLRLDDDEEVMLEAVMKHYRESTKSKAVNKMLRNHMYQVELAKEYIERSRKAEYDLDQLKSAVLELKRQEARIIELVSD